MPKNTAMLAKNNGNNANSVIHNFSVAYGALKQWNIILYGLTCNGNGNSGIEIVILYGNEFISYPRGLTLLFSNHIVRLDLQREWEFWNRNCNIVWQ